MLKLVQSHTCEHTPTSPSPYDYPLRTHEPDEPLRHRCHPNRLSNRSTKDSIPARNLDRDGRPYTFRLRLSNELQSKQWVLRASLSSANLKVPEPRFSSTQLLPVQCFVKLSAAPNLKKAPPPSKKVHVPHSWSGRWSTRRCLLRFAIPLLPCGETASGFEEVETVVLLHLALLRALAGHAAIPPKNAGGRKKTS